MDLTERLGAILRALEITEIVYSLNGSGDSGDAELDSVTYRNDTAAHDLPDIPIFISDSGGIRYLPALLEDIVSDAPDGDWVNNEGGYGTVYVCPFEDEDTLSIECDMTFGEDGDYGDDDDYEDEDFDDDDASDMDETSAEVSSMTRRTWSFAILVMPVAAMMPSSAI